MDVSRILVLLLVLASVGVLGRKKGRNNKRKWPRRFPRPYRWMHYNSNYDPAIEENGCVDVRPLCPGWAKFPGYCGYARGYMMRHCRKSCNLCKAQDEVSIGKTSGVGNSYPNEMCEDRLEDCQTYIKSQSQCVLFSGLMKKYCRKTCGFCCRDTLSDCSLFIKKPSQCRGLNGFFRKYCPNTCQMCGFLLPTKKPGCQDELDDCKSFTPEQCQTQKLFCSKYCAKTCGFCEDVGHSPQGTPRPVERGQQTYSPTNEGITNEFSPSTDSTTQGVISIYQDAISTQGTTRDSSQQGTFPAVPTTSLAESGISASETTGIPNRVTRLADKSAVTDPRTEILRTTASSIRTKTINTDHTTASKGTRDEDSTSEFPASTSSLEVNTATSSTTGVPETDSSAQTTSFPTESTETKAGKTTEESTSSTKTTTAQALRKSTADSFDVGTRAPSKAGTGFVITDKGVVSESPSMAPVSSPRVESSGITRHAETTRRPVSTRIPKEIDTDQSNTVNSTPGGKQEAAKETTAPSILDRIPTTNTIRNTGGTRSRSHVTTDISSTARTDTHNPSPSTVQPVSEVFSPNTESTDELNTRSSDSVAPSKIATKTDTGLVTSGKAETSAMHFTREPTFIKSPDEVDDGFGQSISTTKEQSTTEPIVDTDSQTISTTEALGNRKQNIDAVGPTAQVPTTQSSPLRTKTKKSACVDKLKECANYVNENINYCKYHVHFMHEYCSKSCGFCGHDEAIVPKCEDERKRKCQYFSRYVGYCTINEKYMRRRCPKSCGFCGVAPGSAPMDKTFVRSDQKYKFSIMTQWDGTPIKHAPIKFKLSAEDNANVRLEVSGPLFNQPGPPPCAAGQPCWQLWNYEVAEMFFLGEKEKYLELEVSPHGPHLLLLLDGVRKPFKTKLPMRYSADKDLSSMTWNGTAIIPLDYFPPGMRKINAYAIHGPDNNKIYESLYPATKTAYPDFHRLDFFKDFDFKSMFPSGWHQPISPLWLTSK